MTAAVRVGSPQHPAGVPEKIVKKVVARRGRLHAFETIDPTTTASSSSAG
jgi:hypothetical protein